MFEKKGQWRLGLVVDEGRVGLFQTLINAWAYLNPDSRFAVAGRSLVRIHLQLERVRRVTAAIGIVIPP